MTKYFSKYPKLYYNKNLVVNILTRIKLITKSKRSDALFDDYYIKDGETPDILANKFYGDPEKHWIILLTNEILNVNTDYPLSDQQFIDYLNFKYKDMGDINHPSGLEYASETLNPEPFRYKKEIIKQIVSYEQSLTDEFFISKKEYDSLPAFSSEIITSFDTNIGNFIEVDLSIRKFTVTIYDIEYEKNEKKKKIKILKPNYVNEFERQFINLMRK